MKDRAIQLNDSSTQGTLLDLKINVIKDESGMITSGLCIGNTLEQNKALILLLEPGELKEYPTLGVGILNALLSEDLLFLRHSVRSNFLKDGLNITDLDLYSTSKINIIANY